MNFAELVDEVMQVQVFVASGRYTNWKLEDMEPIHVPIPEPSRYR